LIRERKNTVKKHVLVASTLAVVIALGVVLALAFSSVPFLSSRSAVAHATNPESGAAADDLPSLVPQASGLPSVVAEGVVVPVQHATLSMAASGIVSEILVEEGAVVEEGQVLVRLQNTHQRAAVAEAEAALASAQARFEALQAGARAQEIASAQAGLDAAQARLARLREGARPEEIAAAEASLQAAQATLQRLYDGPEEHTRIAAQADLSNAEAALRQAQAAYDQVAARSDIMMLPQSLQLQQATNAYKAAQARYQALFAEPDADVVANAHAQVKQAQANLDRLRKPVTENEIAEAEAMVSQAQAQLELLMAGTRAEELAAAMAAVNQAKAALQQAQASLDDTELRAPLAGTIAVLYVKEGEQVVAGMPVAQLADLTTWQVETDDLTELDVVNVQEGDQVTLTFDAIPGLELTGRVMRIKPLGEEKQGDITYTAIIRPDQQDPRLRWKMTAVVTIP
jgi:HlyD family secretion protein